MRALHVTEIRDRVMDQIEKIPGHKIETELRHPNNKKKENPTDCYRTNPDSEAVDALRTPLTPRIIQTAGITTELAMDKDARFTLKPKFLTLL